MIGYTTVGTNDLPKAKAFYAAVLAPLGGKSVMSMDRMELYGAGPGPMVGVCTPYDGGKAVPGNGAMVALAAPSREVVDQVHALALANGGTCDGPPGLRGDAFYGAYFRDLDGNKVCAFKMG
ncbi:MAG TPA: VOC family protein [Phenylobacterium sp.]|nr:VOC family protein [Phenylobacterium sp.]